MYLTLYNETSPWPIMSTFYHYHLDQAISSAPRHATYGLYAAGPCLAGSDSSAQRYFGRKKGIIELRQLGLRNTVLQVSSSEYIMCRPPHRKAFHQVRPASNPHTRVPASVPHDRSGLRDSLSLAHHTSLPKRGPLLSRPARDSSVSTATLKYRAMLAQAVHRLQLRPRSTCKMKMKNCGRL